MFELDIIISRQRASNTNYTKANLEHKLSLMNIENIRRYMLLAVEIGKRVMITRNEDDFALEKIMQKQ
jgi:hypothetical protein